MAQFSVIELATQFKAKQSMWSHSPTERMLAANYVQMGHMLEAQEQSNALQERSNAIQGELVDLAIETNSLLSDIGGSLQELKVSQDRTNELLAKSIEVQTDHYMLDKRERVLKDALFRWSEVLTSGEGLSDPHWVLIASRTLMAFLEKWKFSTEDLQDAKEKRSFLDLTKQAKTSIKNSAKEILTEVNLFQALYDEYMKLMTVPEESYASNFTQVPGTADLAKQINQAAERCGIKVSAGSLPCRMLCGLPALSPDFQAAAKTVPFQQNERALFGVYGRAGWVTKRFAVFTDTGWYELDSTSIIPVNNWVRRSYQDDVTFALYDNYKLMNPLADAMALVESVKAFIRAVHLVYKSHEKAIREAIDKQAEDRRTKEQADEEMRVRNKHRRETATRHINEYLDLHPAVEDFYPRVTVG